MFKQLISDMRRVQNFREGPVSLHAPIFMGNEKKYLIDAVDSTFVSSVGAYVNNMEHMLEEYTGAARAVVCVNGTSALEVALHIIGVEYGEYVITQSISFVATANAISHTGAKPIFIDIDPINLGMSPLALRTFLEESCRVEDRKCVLKENGRRVAACVPMHTFGLPCAIDEIADICAEWHIELIEDAAEALGSWYKEKHCGRFARLGCLSFNGNKTVTTGGGGAVLTDNLELGKLVKHLTTTAKLPHKWEYRHDHVAWNFRMPNINAALGCAQMEMLETILERKRWRAERYAELIHSTPWTFIREPKNSRSNYWLCAILFNNRTERDTFLTETYNSDFMTRPVWTPLNTLPMYENCICGDLSTANDIANRLVNIPSGFNQ